MKKFMGKIFSGHALPGVLLGVLLGLFSGLIFASAETRAETRAEIAEGQKLAFDRSKGNCLACHFAVGGRLPGNSGPALVAMKQRFPERDILVSQISDARRLNPRTMMPPFGSHEILSEVEISLIVDWLYTL